MLRRVRWGLASKITLFGKALLRKSKFEHFGLGFNAKLEVTEEPVIASHALFAWRGNPGLCF
jgi:hypothetical protein